ncbi:MAG: pitrilysin family protein [Candidatus Firestonebacteria bacterium]
MIKKILYIICFLLFFSASHNIYAQIDRCILPNGLTVILKENTANDIIGLVLFVKTGSVFENEENNGITSLTQNLLLKGTLTRNALSIANELESIGADLDVAVTEDYAEISLMATKKYFKQAFDIFADVVLNPSFPIDEIEKEKNNAISRIKSLDDSTFEFTFKRFKQELYGVHPYKFSAIGTIESIKKIKREDILNWYKRFYVPNNIVISSVGKIEEVDLLNQIKNKFGNLKKKDVSFLELKSVVLADVRQEKSFEKEIKQAMLIIGYNAINVRNDDYPALKVVNGILGSGMSSRLFKELREKQSLAYEVGSFFPSRYYDSFFAGYIGTGKENINKAKEGILKEFERLKTDEILDDELERAKNSIIGNFALEHQKNIKQAWYLGWFELLGCGYSYDEQYPIKIKTVTNENIKSVINKYFSKPAIVITQPK